MNWKRALFRNKKKNGKKLTIRAQQFFFVFDALLYIKPIVDDVLLNKRVWGLWPISWLLLLLMLCICVRSRVFFILIVVDVAV